MISFSALDIVIIFVFFSILLVIGFLPSSKKNVKSVDFLLSGRNVGLFLFVLTTVSTWYGGILGVGEFTYRYGILSWITQGLPYYIFAILFAFFFAGKVRSSLLFTIPEKLESVYGRKVALASSILIFILVSPAPYLLMIGTILTYIFNIDLLTALIISSLLSFVYLIKGGYKSDLYTDVFQFFIMFLGFGLIVLISFNTIGDFKYLSDNLPSGHLSIPNEVSPFYIFVWFAIALWTFADPGFHQRSYAAKDEFTAKWGIIISVLLWAVFDFLTTTTGLFAKAALPNIENPIMAYPLYAEKVLSTGFKGIFYTAMIATILSTSNSFMFLSASTLGNDLLGKNTDDKKKILWVRIGILITAVISVILAYSIQSVISLWYTIGSICIPGIVLLIISSYYKKFMIPNSFAFFEIIAATLSSLLWWSIRDLFNSELILLIEPMIVGLLVGFLIHLLGMINLRKRSF